MDKTLTAEQLKAMEAVAKGGDVWNYSIARALRAVQQAHPEYIQIGDAMKAPKSGAAAQPYFGAILTAAGRKAIRA